MFHVEMLQTHNWKSVFRGTLILYFSIHKNVVSIVNKIYGNYLKHLYTQKKPFSYNYQE